MMRKPGKWTPILEGLLSISESGRRCSSNAMMIFPPLDFVGDASCIWANDALALDGDEDEGELVVRAESWKVRH